MSMSTINDALHRALDALDEAINELHEMRERAQEDGRISDASELARQAHALTRIGREMAEYIV